jgi:hypothetical protein
MQINQEAQEAQEAPGLDMNSQLMPRLIFTPEEIYFLLCLLPVPGVIGVRDPFPGMLREEMDLRLDCARESLVQRGLVRIEPGKPITVDLVLAGLLGAMAFTRYTLKVSQGRALDAPEQVHYHLNDSFILEQQTLDGGHIALSYLPDLAATVQKILLSLRLHDAPAANGPMFTLAPADMNTLHRLASTEGLQACIAHLNNLPVPPATVIPLAQTLVYGQHGSVELLLREPRAVRYVSRLAWLAGKSGAWLILYPVDTDGARIEVIPLSKSELEARVKDTLHKVQAQMPGKNS